MNQDKQPDALRLADAMSAEYFGLTAQQAAAELRRLHAESEQHMQELRSYRITVENREARIAELEAQLAAAQQDAQQLHSDIMNIQAGKRIGLSYREGHRDARHAAAELVLAAQAKQGEQP